MKIALYISFIVLLLFSLKGDKNGALLCLNQQNLTAIDV